MSSLLFLATLAHATTVRATVAWTEEGPQILDAVRHEGQLVHSHPGDLVIRDASGAVLQTVALPDARTRSIALPGGGGEVAKVSQAVSVIEIPWPEGAKALELREQRLEPSLPMQPIAKPPPGELAAIVESGPSDQRLDLVFLGDGYRENEQADFRQDAQRITDYVLSVQPYKRYQGLFNIWRIEVVSNESGVSKYTSTATVDKDTALGCYYGCGSIDRLVCCDDGAVMTTVSAALPGADGILVLLNDDTYGGSGGFNYATSYTGLDYGNEVAAHELGHSLIGLWDEYSYGTTGNDEGPNCSSDATGEATWGEWLDEGGIDAYPVCSYTNLYRPTDAGCMMNTLQDDYCAVCRQEAVLAIYGRLPGLASEVFPAEGSDVTVAEGDEPVEIGVTPLADTVFTYSWELDGEALDIDTPSLTLKDCSGLTGSLTLTVADESAWVRYDPNSLLVEQYGPWQVESSGDGCAPDLSELLDACGCHTSGSGLPASLALGLVALFARKRREI